MSAPSPASLRHLWICRTLRQLRSAKRGKIRSEEHTSELQSQSNLVCRLLLEKKKKTNISRLRPAKLDRRQSPTPSRRWSNWPTASRASCPIDLTYPTIGADCTAYTHALKTST